MSGRKLLIIITPKGKKLLALFPAALLLYILAIAAMPAYYNLQAVHELKVIVDPGHGGIDGGTGEGTGVLEKDINLAIALKLSEELKSTGILADMTRESDISLDNLNNSSPYRHERDLMARVNKINSGSYNCFLSVHANHCYGGGMGPLVLYCPESEKSALLASFIQNKLNEVMSRAINESFNRKPVSGDYYLLVNSNIPGVIIETGFVSNDAERIRLCSPGYQQELAAAIRDGVWDYLRHAE